jgi:hypothetical protein
MQMALYIAKNVGFSAFEQWGFHIHFPEPGSTTGGSIPSFNWI